MQEFDDFKTLIMVGFVMPLLFVLAMLLLSSCSMIGTECPVAIVNSEVKVGMVDRKHNIAGAYFDCVNISEYDIEKLVIAYDLFDMSDKNPKFVRHCEAVFSGYFEKGEASQLVHSLDGLFSGKVSSDYAISNIYVKDVLFTDSSVWSNGGWILA